MLKRKSVAVGLCVCTALLSMVGCKGERPVPDSLPDRTESVIEIPDAWLKREIPQDYVGQGEHFALREEDYTSDSTAAVLPVILHCSDGAERQSYSITETPVYLLESVGDSKTANGVFSTSDNITLMSQTGLLQENSIDTVLDELIARQAATTHKDSVFMVSDTLHPSPNVLLTSTICKEGAESLETFYVLQLLDRETVQVFILSRVSEKMDLTAEEAAQMSIEELTKYCLSSGDNRDVFCGMLQSLLTQLARQ